MKQVRRVRDMSALTLHAIDGQVGPVQELYFDDQRWAVRYFIINTDAALSGRNVPVAPCAVSEIDHAKASIRTNLRKQQIEQAPPVDTAEPISRQYEEQYYTHYGWAPYWQTDTTWWPTPIYYPNASVMILDKPLLPASAEQSHLRSSGEVTGYRIFARDGEIGYVEDLVVDDEDWVIRYIVVDTRNWLPGKTVLVQSGRIEQIDWHSRSVTLSLTRQAIRSAPAYDPSQHITPEYETHLFEHYGKQAA